MGRISVLLDFHCFVLKQARMILYLFTEVQSFVSIGGLIFQHYFLVLAYFPYIRVTGCLVFSNCVILSFTFFTGDDVHLMHIKIASLISLQGGSNYVYLTSFLHSLTISQSINSSFHQHRAMPRYFCATLTLS